MVSVRARILSGGVTVGGGPLTTLSFGTAHLPAGRSPRNRILTSPEPWAMMDGRTEKEERAVYDELTAVDIRKMKEELEHRIQVLRPQLIEEVQTARAFGDLSENYEYKCAKQAKNRNDSRIRYLEQMIRTAKVIEVPETADAAGLFDRVTIYNEMAKREMEIRIVTTLRQDALKGLISKESPVGRAVLGRRVGDRVPVEVSPEVKYFVEIRKIEKGEDDETLEISAY